jgi:hypothetical protein
MGTFGIQSDHNKVQGDFNQTITINQWESGTDLSELKNEIAKLREALSKDANSKETGTDIGRLSEAKGHFEHGNNQAAYSALKKLSKKAVETALSLGMGLLSKDIANLLKL